MDKKPFKRLVDSMEQVDEIVRGVREPSREYFIDAIKSDPKAVLKALAS